jgi:hypothetical protein
LVAVATVAVVANEPAPASAQQDSECPNPPQVSAAGGHEPIRLKIDGDSETTLVFGTYRTSPRNLAIREDFVDPGAPPIGTNVNFDVSRLVRSDQEGTEIPGNQVSVAGCVGRDQQHVAILLQVDPKAVAAGTYTGTLRVNDPAFDSVQSTPIKVTVILQEPRRYIVIVLLVVAALVAAFVQCALRVFDVVPFRRLVDTKLLRIPVLAVEFASGFLAGLVAVIPVYVAKYADDAGWTLDANHAWILLTTAFIAASTGYAAGAVPVRRMMYASEGRSGV